MNRTSVGRYSSLPALAVLLLLFTSYCWLTTYSSSTWAFGIDDFLFISLLCVLVVAIEFALAAGGLYLNRNLGILVVATSAIMNMLSTYLIATPEFALDDWWMRLAKVMGMIALCWIFFSQVIQFLWFRRTVLFILIAVTAFEANEARVRATETDKMIVEETSAGPGLTISPMVRHLEFQHKPNVYFIFFDGMLPEKLHRVLVSDFLGIDEKPAYIAALERSEFRTMNNHFSDSHWTLPSISMFLQMRSGYHTGDGEVHRGIMTGLAPSPLVQIFQENGYRSIFLYTDAFFGTNKSTTRGPHVDHLKQPKLLERRFCGQSHSLWYFFGYCYFVFGFEGATGNSGLANSQAAPYTHWFISQLQHFLEEESGPKLFLTYLYAPRHLPPMLEFERLSEEERVQLIEDYRTLSSSAAASIDSIVAFIVENDPDALSLVMGDHGVFTRVSPSDEIPVWKNPGEIRAVVQRIYGAYGGVRDQGICAEYIIPQTFSVNSWLARQLVRCLAGGEDPFIKEPSYHITEEEIDRFSLVGSENEAGQFLNFLYE